MGEPAKRIPPRRTKEGIKSIKVRPDANRGSDIFMIPIDALLHHPANPREDLGDLEELTESIRKNGVMQNLTVVPVGLWDNDEYDADEIDEIADELRLGAKTIFEEFYVLIGNRRFEASKAAGLEELPCKIVYDISKSDQLGIMLTENIQRTDLTIPEQAYGFQRLIDLGKDVDDIVESTGFSHSTVYHRLNIAKLDRESVEEGIKSHQLTMNDFIKLESVKDVDVRNDIIKNHPGSIEFYVEHEKKKEEAREWKIKVLRKIEKNHVTDVFPEDKNTFDPGWERVLTLNNTSDPDVDAIDVSGLKDSPVYYKMYGNETYPSLYFYQYDEETALEQEKRAENEGVKDSKEQKNREALDKIHMSLNAQVKEFIGFLIKKEIETGECTSVTKEEICALWNIIAYDEEWIDIQGSVVKTVKDYMEFDNFEEVAETISAPLQMGIVIANELMDTNPRTYNNTFDEENGSFMQDCILALKMVFALEFENNQEIASLVTGAHKAYRKESE